MTDPMMKLRDELRQLAEERVEIHDGRERGKAVRARPEWRAATELARLTAERDKLTAGLDALCKVLAPIDGPVSRTVRGIIDVLRTADGVEPGSLTATAEAMIQAATEPRQ